MGTLSEQEAQIFAEHLGTCPICRAEVERLDAADTLAEAVLQVVPPAGLRERVIASIQAEAALFEAAGEVDDRRQPAPVHKRKRPLVLASVGAALLFVVGALVGSALTADDRADDDRPAVRTVRGSVTSKGGGPSARAAIVIRDSSARLVLTDVAPPPSGQVYQVWLLRPGTDAIPTGAIFAIPRSGDTEVSLPDLRGVESLIVTAETPRGRTTPTLPALFTFRLAG